MHEFLVNCACLQIDDAQLKHRMGGHLPQVAELRCTAWGCVNLSHLNVSAVVYTSSQEPLIVAPGPVKASCVGFMAARSSVSWATFRCLKSVAEAPRSVPARILVKIHHDHGFVSSKCEAVSRDGYLPQH